MLNLLQAPSPYVSMTWRVMPIVVACRIGSIIVFMLQVLVHAWIYLVAVHV